MNYAVIVGMLQGVVGKAGRELRVEVADTNERKELMSSAAIYGAAARGFLRDGRIDEPRNEASGRSSFIAPDAAIPVIRSRM